MGVRSKVARLLSGEAAGGVVLIAAAAAALIIANSQFSKRYFVTVAYELGPLTVGHWINDALMAIFFLFVGLEIKREALEGQLTTWSQRILPGIAALGGMAGPALIYLAFNHGDPGAMRGWAIPTATDIAFALGVLALLGERVPPSLKLFLTALAIIDDLGAVIIIACFYTSGLSIVDFAGAAIVLCGMWLLNRRNVATLWPYLILGVVLWIFVYRSGIHATLAGVAMAMMIPMRLSPTKGGEPRLSPLHRLEHSLHLVVPFAVVPLFGFANAGVVLTGLSPSTFTAPITLGIAVALVVGKLAGVLGSSLLAVACGWAQFPKGARLHHFVGVALLCGIGFTMSLFIGLLAFESDPTLQTQMKVGIIAGSLVAAVAGSLMILAGSRRSKSS